MDYTSVIAYMVGVVLGAALMYVFTMWKVDKAYDRGWSDAADLIRRQLHKLGRDLDTTIGDEK